MSSTDQCAVGPDGQLLPASKIVFYNDLDDADPLPPTSSAEAAAPTQITQYFRRSERPRKQSSRLTDPNNAEIHKRKAGDTDEGRPSVRSRRSSPTPPPMDEDEDADDDMPGLDPLGDSEDEEDDNDEHDMDEINAAYQYTKALGDADRADTLISALHRQSANRCS
ncbi:hypothetical protein C8R45DRAFT_943118 [Mycena sanguinolenta]|nr:hypothetical protein C8R45DRAFT_943118 [Mycena sanguinolenta]